MDAHDIIGLILTLTAICSYINYRYLKLPPSIGVTIIAVFVTLIVKIISANDYIIYSYAVDLTKKIEFEDNFLHGMLGFLVFANAIHLNSKELLRHKFLISIYATVSVVISAVLIACATYWISGLFDIYIPFYYCLAFGALISPTDAITVIAVMKTVKIPKSMEMKITGEALFNDGMGIALFFMALSLAHGEMSAMDPATNIFYFLREACGGIIFGGMVGWLGSRLLDSIENHQIAIIITLALVAGGYILATDILEVSGAIAMAVAGLVLGYYFAQDVDNRRTTRSITDFWEIIDQLLNAILFVLIGIELIVINIHWKTCFIAMIIIVVGLLARWVSIVLPTAFLHKFDRYNDTLVKLMVWSGIRGGISIALALSISGPYSEVILTMTYIVVLFSMLVQGLTMKPVAERLLPTPA